MNAELRFDDRMEFSVCDDGKVLEVDANYGYTVCDLCALHCIFYMSFYHKLEKNYMSKALHFHTHEMNVLFISLSILTCMW